MSKNKIYIEFEGFEEIISKLKMLDSNIKKTTEKALTKTHEYVTEQAEKYIEKPYLPRKGKYSTGITKKSLVKKADIEWEGTVASVKTGFDIKNGGIASIFLMYGTPRMEPDKDLYNAFYGNRTRKEISNIQEDIFYDELRSVDK